MKEICTFIRAIVQAIEYFCDMAAWWIVSDLSEWEPGVLGIRKDSPGTINGPNCHSRSYLFHSSRVPQQPATFAESITNRYKYY